MMKKLILPLFLLATMFACTSPETKKADVANAEDTEGGIYVSLDDKTAKTKQLIEAYMKNDTSVAHEFYADTLKVVDGFADNVDSLNNYKVTPGGRSAFIKADMYTHTLFSDIKISLKKGNLKTFTGNNGQVASGYWGVWTGKGKYTNAETKVPLHMLLWWKGDKIVQIYRIFDPSTLKAEVAASQKK
jgi:hypothetical protein